VRAVGRTVEFEAQTVRLQEANVALKVLLDNRKQELNTMLEGAFDQSFAQPIIVTSPMAGQPIYWF
jgi:hypothetical protein